MTATHLLALLTDIWSGTQDIWSGTQINCVTQFIDNMKTYEVWKEIPIDKIKLMTGDQIY